MVFLDVGVELFVAEFVALFVLAVVGQIFLDGVVCEVNRLIGVA